MWGSNLQPRDQESHSRGVWVAQSVECLALDFSSGQDPMVLGIETRVGFQAKCGSCLGFSPLTLSLSVSLSLNLSLPLPLSPAHLLSLFLKN